MDPVAVIMRSKDEMPHVQRALERLGRQRGCPFVLFNVDSGSTDGTLEVIQKANPERLTRIRPEDYVAGRVLNLMVEKATSAIVVFLNADAIPLHDDWLALLVEPIARGTADATCSRQEPRAEATFLVRFDHARAFNPTWLTPDNDTFFSAVSCAFRRSLWEKQRFREEGIAEDLEWSRRCRRDGARFVYVPDSRVEHSHNYSTAQIRRREFGHGMAYAHIFGQRPSLVRQVGRCLKEILRDALEAARTGHLRSVAANLAFRVAYHSAHYRGLREYYRRLPPKEVPRG
jgi:rhamnosyltransferase